MEIVLSNDDETSNKSFYDTIHYSLKYPKGAILIVYSLYYCMYCIPVAQLVKYGTSNAMVMDLILIFRERTDKMYLYSYVYKTSAKSTLS